LKDLKHYLSRDLPAYMVPSYFVQLEKLPLSSTGKLDRKSLPEPGLTVSGEYTAPRDKIEEKLVEIWRDILDISPTGPAIGIDDDFFHLGGHSLKATVLASRIRKGLDVNITLSEIFTTPFIRGLAAVIAQTRPDKYIALEPVETKEYYPTSSAQRRLYVLQLMDKESVGYNLPMIWQVTGTVDGERIQVAFQRLVQRHESLRTSFYMMKDKTVQRVHPQIKFEMCHVDPHLLMEDFVRPFDLSNAPLLRAGLVKKGDRGHLLLIDMHHIVSDGASMQVFIKDFIALYEGKPLPFHPLQYKDFSQWQNSFVQKDLMKQQEVYWLKQFEGEVPVLDLPIDFPRPPIQSFEGESIDFRIGGREYDALTSLSRNRGVTLYMLLLSIFTLFLSKISGQEDIIVGSPIAGRGHAGLEDIIGMFVNTLTLRNFPSGGKTFIQFLEEVKKRTLDAFENQDYQYEDLVEKVVVGKDTSRNPLFDTMFALQNIDIPEIRIPGLTLTQASFEQKVAKFDLLLVCIERDEQLSCTFEYCTKLFKPATIQRFVNWFKTASSSFLKNIDNTVADVEIISREEKRRVLFRFNETDTQYPKTHTIHQLFEEQAEKIPHSIAIAHEGSQISYKRLNEESNRWAGVLRKNGAEPGNIIAMIVHRSIEMIIGILGILKCGAAYLPIDPEFPG
ncbi:MAG: AMP-binding protein, partial [bacterium]|nr:AMP-binding protein [bacterium]